MVATSERGEVYVAWRTGAGGGGDVRARRKDGEKGFEPEFVASNPAFGAGRRAVRDRRRPPGRLRSVAMLQGAGGRAITAAVYDRPPGRARRRIAAYWRRASALIRVAGGRVDLWGRQTFTVLVDGGVVGRRPRLARPASALGEGGTAYQVIATTRARPGVDEPRADAAVDPRPPTLRIARGAGRAAAASRSRRGGDRAPACDYVEID